MRRVARDEKLQPSVLRRAIANGTIVIPANPAHRTLQARGIGKGLATKVNANFGTSSDYGDAESERAKLRTAVAAGADSVMDLSTGGDIVGIRRAIVAASPVMVGTVPIYQAAVAAIERHGAIVMMAPDEIFEAIEDHARDGVDFITVHCGVTRQAVGHLRKRPRHVDVVSRGGSFTIAWMLHHDAENPLYEDYDRLLEIARRHDVTLSLGDGMRPGCLADASDAAQIEELIVLGELVARARAAGVQVMVEGPGHLPLQQIQANVALQKSLCNEAPFYVLGPLVTDVAPGYDHITGAIGGALAAWAGADFLCYVTPAEHLGLPTQADVHQGVVASRIAAHAADIANGTGSAGEWDLQMARARKAIDWEAQASLAIDTARVHQMRQDRATKGKACSMCGNYCAMELMAEYLGSPIRKC
jgi:phosphomethylpyrimidine synthase